MLERGDAPLRLLEAPLEDGLRVVTQRDLHVLGEVRVVREHRRRQCDLLTLCTRPHQVAHARVDDERALGQP